MATFVLVGGAWLGAWVRRGVTRLLRSRGHDVFPATLTGLADRGHLANPSVDLDTHITDVVRLMEFEDVADAILVGHSYAGGVVTGVADRAADRLALLLFCDSAPLADGQSMLGCATTASASWPRLEPVSMPANRISARWRAMIGSFAS